MKIVRSTVKLAIVELNRLMGTMKKRRYSNMSAIPSIVAIVAASNAAATNASKKTQKK
jgi:ribosomal protein L7/L12